MTTTKELIKLINSSEDGEIWLYDNRLKNHLSLVEQALEEDLIYFVKSEDLGSVTEYLRVSF